MTDVDPASPRRRVRAEVPVALAVALAAAIFVTFPRTPEAAGALETFLREGPEPGTWEIASFMGTRRYHYGPDPGDARCCVLLPAAENGGNGKARIVPRKRAVQWFVPGCRERFLRNYRVAETASDGELRLVTWRPRNEGRGETARRIWIDPTDGCVVRLEDRAANGEVILGVRRLAPPPAAGLPVPADAEVTRECLERATWERCHPPSFERIQAEAPFGLLRPRHIPVGFGLKEAAFRSPGGEQGVAWFTFTDGLAVFALVMGPPAALAAFEGRFGGNGRGGGGQQEAPEAPGTQDPQSDPIRVRCHHSPRRIVLRLEHESGLGVLLLGRNELSEAEYLRILQGLAPMATAAK